MCHTKNPVIGMSKACLAYNRAGQCPAQSVFFNTRCGGLSGAEIPGRRVLGITGSIRIPQSGGLEFRAAPTAWGCRARTTCPTGHDTVTLCLYSAKGQCSLSVFVRTKRRAGECQSPFGKPKAVGGECAPDNPPQHISGRGSPRTTSHPL
jgi:hypothetical protein